MSADDPRRDVACDPQSAIARLGGESEIFKDLLYALLGDHGGHVAQLRLAIAAQDASGVHRAAHSVRGLAATCGADLVAQLAGELEHFGCDKDLLEAAAKLLDLDLALERTERELAGYLDRGPVRN